jgi:hypothetical protein
MDFSRSFGRHGLLRNVVKQPGHRGSDGFVGKVERQDFGSLRDRTLAALVALPPVADLSFGAKHLFVGARRAGIHCGHIKAIFFVADWFS